jgi:hypothetical protein
MRSAHAIVALALAAAALLVGIEIHRGALSEGALAVPDPCDRRVDVATTGLDGAAQRVGLQALDAAACGLGTTREELVISIAGHVAEGRELPDEVAGALRSGLEEAIDREEAAGRIGRVGAFLLRQAARRAPVEWILAAVERAGLLG